MSSRSILGLVLVASCARGAGLEGDAGVTAEAAAADVPKAATADVPAAIGDGPRADLGPELAPGDAADRKTVCQGACAWLTEPCTRYTPPQAPICLEACLKRSDTELACAWAALNGGVPDVSVQCAELARCLGLP